MICFQASLKNRDKCDFPPMILRPFGVLTHVSRERSEPIGENNEKTIKELAVELTIEITMSCDK